MTALCGNSVARRFSYRSSSGSQIVSDALSFAARWYRNDVEMEGETTNTLVVHQISRDYDGDTVACVGTNRVGGTRRELTLRVECRHPGCLLPSLSLFLPFHSITLFLRLSRSSSFTLSLKQSDVQ